VLGPDAGIDRAGSPLAVVACVARAGSMLSAVGIRVSSRTAE